MSQSELKEKQGKICDVSVGAELALDWPVKIFKKRVIAFYWLKHLIIFLNKLCLGSLRLGKPGLYALSCHYKV